MCLTRKNNRLEPRLVDSPYQALLRTLSDCFNCNTLVKVNFSQAEIKQEPSRKSVKKLHFSSKLTLLAVS